MTHRARPADFDSATVMTTATARFLAGKDFPILGKRFGWALRPLLIGVNHLPERTKRWLYRTGSGREGLSEAVMAKVDEEELARQVVSRFPARRYPGALIGSTPGSAVHLAAALGCPLLPQTLLLPLRRRRTSVDDPIADIEAARPAAEQLIAANPHLVVHQMADPNNDRLTLSRFSYFRVKRTALGATYRRFLERSVEPGGTLYVIDSQWRWPTTRLGERHLFQFGGVGGVTPQEYLHGSPRIAGFLRRERSERRRWTTPVPDGESVEAEWGFEPGLATDIEAFAHDAGFRVRHLAFDHADDLSPFVADLYRWWYDRRAVPARRLFVESFVLVDPYWMLRAGAVPFWLTFNTDAALQTLERYLAGTKDYEEIDVTLVSNGARGIGVPDTELWHRVFERASRRGGFAGVDTKRFPADLAVFARYRDSLRAARPRLELPEPLSIGEFEEFAATVAVSHRVAMG